MRYLSDVELEKLLSFIRERADLAKRRGTSRAVIDEAIVLLLLNTGLRPSELCNLTIADLIKEQERKVIMVRGDSGNVPREIDVTGDILESLLRFVRLYRKDAEPSDPLLVNEHGTKLGYMSLYNKLKRIGKSAKVGNLHPRILRATYLVRLYNKKQDLWFVQQQAGHASPRTTAIYATAGSDSHSLYISQDQRVPEMMEKANRSSKQMVTYKSSAEIVEKHRETIFIKDPQQDEKCEACGKPISDKSGIKIDSGQVLCVICIKELRKG